MTTAIVARGTFPQDLTVQCRQRTADIGPSRPVTDVFADVTKCLRNRTPPQEGGDLCYLSTENNCPGIL
jgi:hypothetical protein